MNNGQTRAFTYIKMTFLLLVLAAIVVYIAGNPLAAYAVAQGNMIIYKGAPGYADGDGSSGTDADTNGILQMSEIKIPEPDTQYATITCKRISLKAPVYYGDNDADLEKGAGQYTGSGMPGEGRPVLIAGHDTTFFAPLKNLEPGDIISISAGYGEFHYKVVSTSITDKSDTTAFNPAQDKEQLILYTCYPFGEVTGNRSSRYFVYCDRVFDTQDITN